MNQRTKTVCRRVIRLLMVLLAAFLLAVAVGIPIINNGIAHGLEKHLKSIPLPADTQLVDSVSVAGKINGNSNGMEYQAAILIQSTLSLAELQDYYAVYAGENWGHCLVTTQHGQRVEPFDYGGMGYRQPVGDEGYYTVYSFGSSYDYPMRSWLDLDLRGH